MSNESVEVQLARVDEQLKMILRDLKDAKTDRKGQYNEIEGLKVSVSEMNSKLNNVETKLAGQAPTIEEFITIKHKVVGAGKLGRGVWIAGAAIIAFIYSFREAIANILQKI